MTSFDRSPAALRAYRDALHASSFAPEPSERRGIGAEVELLALDVASRRPVTLADGATPLVPLLRRHSTDVGWTEFAAYDGTVRFDAGGDGTISFEPGGQIEFSSRPSASVAELVELLARVIHPLRERLAGEGIETPPVGIDPHNDAYDIELQLPVDRYQRMTRHFESIGPYGVRMMRQTAAMQVSIDRGMRPVERWRLLNDLAPYLIAIFASSPVYRGEHTGHQSYRAHCWRQLDPMRTGMSAPSSDPAAEYARFAAGAPDMIGAGWDAHLTTLFPEVRPRGHYEVRSCDAIDPRWYAAPLVLLAGLAYDERAAADARLLAADSHALLRAAGERGLRDPAIARTARDLVQLALDGARRLGDYVGRDALETATEFFTRFTLRDLAPADDPANLARIRTVRSKSSRV